MMKKVVPRIMQVVREHFEQAYGPLLIGKFSSLEELNEHVRQVADRAYPGTRRAEVRGKEEEKIRLAFNQSFKAGDSFRKVRKGYPKGIFDRRELLLNTGQTLFHIGHISSQREDNLRHGPELSPQFFNQGSDLTGAKSVFHRRPTLPRQGDLVNIKYSEKIYPESIKSRLARMNEDRPVALRNPRVIARLARQTLGRIFRREDLRFNLFNFDIPSAIAAPDSIGLKVLSDQAEKLIDSEKAWHQMTAASGVSAQADSRILFAVGPAWFQEAGLVLPALQKRWGPKVRFAVIQPPGESPEWGEVISQKVQEMNRALPSDQQILVKAHPRLVANTFKRQYQMEGLGVGAVDAALIRQIIPDFKPWSQSQLDTFVSGFPGLAELLAQFHSDLQRALETAA